MNTLTEPRLLRATQLTREIAPNLPRRRLAETVAQRMERVVARLQWDRAEWEDRAQRLRFPTGEWSVADILMHAG